MNATSQTNLGSTAARWFSSAVTSRQRLAEYDVGMPIGEGQFAKVRRCARLRDGKLFAVKTIQMLPTETSAVVMHELAIWRLLGEHRHICSLVENFRYGTSWYIVMEHVDGKDVHTAICSNGPFSESRAALVVRQTASALAHMHALDVVHRDIKPENLVRPTPHPDARPPVLLCICTQQRPCTLMRGGHVAMLRVA